MNLLLKMYVALVEFHIRVLTDSILATTLNE